MNRNEKIRACINPRKEVGLEIGSLNNPIVSPNEGRIYYCDHLSTEDLKKKYQHDPNVDTSKIVNVNYVWGKKTLREAVGGEKTFDYIIASHVVEHIPDIIGWFFEISEILRVGGILSLIIPDKRYTFDCLRGVSRPAELIEAYLMKLRKPSIRQIFDSHYYSTAFVEASTAWSESFNKKELRKTHHHPYGVFELCREVQEKKLYYDSHCYTFTPESIIEILEIIIQLNLFDFKVEFFPPTKFKGMEFYISLSKLSEYKNNEERIRIQLDSLFVIREQDNMTHGEVPGRGFFRALKRLIRSD